MQIVETVSEMLAIRRTWDGSGEVGLVPTMGYLHAGDRSLVRQARSENRLVVVSIFVNPTQFGQDEDFAEYPRDRVHDMDMLADSGADIVFVPSVEDMYPPGFATYVGPSGPVADVLEGTLRPGHFTGFTTIALLLYNIARPHQVYLSHHHAQHIAVLRRVITDLRLPVSVRALPVMREPDGLVMDPRNCYLSPTERNAAVAIYRALKAGRALFEQRSRGGVADVEAGIRSDLEAEPLADVNYVGVVDPDTFEPKTDLRGPALLVASAQIGETRLVDHLMLRADGTWDMGILLPATSTVGDAPSTTPPSSAT